jgi:hypothetical protein
MLEHGDRNPIWITEFGYSTTTQSNWLGGVDEETQADYLTRSYRVLQSDRTSRLPVGTTCETTSGHRTSYLGGAAGASARGLLAEAGV